MGLLAVLTIALFLCPFRIGVVSGHSMSPTLEDGDLYLIDRTYYRRHPVRRGDVVIFRHAGETYIKRVLALPGDTVYVWKYRGDREDTLIEACQLEPFRRAVRQSTWARTIRLVKRRLPPGTCYVVGDNIQGSVDSRVFGPIPLEAIAGRVITAPPRPDSYRVAGVFRSPGSSAAL